MELKRVDCPVCGGGRLRIWNTCGITAADCAVMAGGELTLARCSGCGFIFIDPQPRFSTEELERIYSPGYFRSFGVGAGEGYEYRLRLIEGCKAKGSMLEIGCGDGGFLEAARARGWEASGLDVSACAVRAAGEKGIRVFHGTLEQAGFAAASFDAVACADLVEHVADPSGLLRQAHRVLKPDGILYISVPNIASLHYRAMGLACRLNHRNYFLLPHHLCHFSPGTLARLCSRCGFTITRMERTQSAYPGKGIKNKLVRVLYSLGTLAGQPDRLTAIAVKV